MSASVIAATLILLASLAGSPPERPLPGRKAPETLVVFPMAFYGKGANSLAAGDSLVARMADSILRADLQRTARFTLIDPERISRTLSQAEAGGNECVSLECRRSVSQKLGAAWMVTTKLSKTSNLIWYLSGQLTDIRTGRRLLDDEFELKGIADDIAKGGAHSLARRIVKAAGAGPETAAARTDTARQTGSADGGTRLDPAALKSKLAAATEDKAPDLRRVDLSGLDLSGVDFKRADLSGARLVGTKLVGANLFTADLTDAVLTDADLSRANLDGSVLRRANFQRAKLEGASLFATIIESADLRNADLSGARIIGYLRGAKLARANLRGANAGADPGNQSMGVMRATFVGADLSGADLTSANLFKADFSHANLTDAKLARANLMNADLIQTDLTRSDVTGAKLGKANLDEAVFKDAVGVDRIEGLDQARNRDKAVFTHE